MRVSETHKLQSVPKSRGQAREDSNMILSWGSNGGFPRKLFWVWRTGALRALAAALGRWVLEDLSEGSPWPRAGQRRRRLAPGGAVEDCFISK